jgi:hypothetical protein
MPEQTLISPQAQNIPAAGKTELSPLQENEVQDTSPEKLRHLTIQRKMTMGSADDPLEDEADAMADKVMRQTKPPFIQKKSLNSDKADFQSKTGAQFIQRKCVSCEEDKESLLRKPLDPFVQKKGNEGQGIVNDTLTGKIQSQKGEGNPLSNNTRAPMEESLGADLSKVRIHTGEESVQLAKELNAQAFTVGNDIYFNSGKYSPESESGKFLLAHELTHTVQQSDSQVISLRRKPDELAFYVDSMGGKSNYEMAKDLNLETWYAGYKFFNLFKEEGIYPGSHPNAYATRVYELQEHLNEALGDAYFPHEYITGVLEIDISKGPTIISLIGLASRYATDPSNNFGINPDMLKRINTLVSSVEKTPPPLASLYFSGVGQLALVNASKSFHINTGDRGIFVERIQMALLSLNYTIGDDFHISKDGKEKKVTGVFNNGTKNAIEQFQIDSGMEGKDIDGVVGQLTLRLLDKRLDKSLRSSAASGEINAVRVRIPVSSDDLPTDPGKAETVKKDLLIRAILTAMPLSKDEAQNLVNSGWHWIEYTDVTLSDITLGYKDMAIPKQDYEAIMGKRTGGSGKAIHISEQIIDQGLELQKTTTLYNINKEISKIQSEINKIELKMALVGFPLKSYRDEIEALKRQLADKTTERNAELNKLGITQEQYDNEKGDFVKTFLQYSAMIAFKMLQQNEVKATVEYVHYDKNPEATKQLKEAITKLNELYGNSETYFMQGISWEETKGENTEKYKSRIDYVMHNQYCDEGGCNGSAIEQELNDKWKAGVEKKSTTNDYFSKMFDEEKKAFDFLSEKAGVFPILGNPNFNVRDKGKGYVNKTDEDLKQEIKEQIGTRDSGDGILKNIANTRERIRENVNLIWEMPPVIALAKMELGILKDSVLDNILNDAYKAHQDKGFWETVFKVALGIGLGLLALVSGPVGWIALAGSIAYGAYDAYSTLQDIRTKREASETAIDEDMALMHDKPSYVWFVISLVGVGLDAAQALKIVKAAKAGIDLAEGVKGEIRAQRDLSKFELEGLKKGSRESVEVTRRIERLEKALEPGAIDWVHYAEHSKILKPLKDNPFAVRFMADALKDKEVAKAFTKLGSIGLAEDVANTVIGMYAGVGKKAIGEFPEVMRLIESGKFARNPELVNTILTDLKVQKALLDSGDTEKFLKLYSEWKNILKEGKTLSFAEHLSKSGLNTFFSKGISLTDRFGADFAQLPNLIKNKYILREIEPLLVDSLNLKQLPASVQRSLEVNLQRDIIGLTNDLGIAQERMVKEIQAMGQAIQFQSEYLAVVSLLQKRQSRKLLWEAATQLPGRDEYLKMIDELAAQNPKVNRVIDDLIKIGPMTDKSSLERLLADDVLRRTLAENPLAVLALKKCASPCFPPNATPDQIKRITALLTGKSQDEIAKVNDLIYRNRDTAQKLETAIKKLEGNFDETLSTIKLPEIVLPRNVKSTSAIKSMTESIVALGLPTAQLNSILKNIAEKGGSAAASRVDGVLRDLIMALQMERKVSLKNFGVLLKGLEDADLGTFKAAEFLLDEIARYVKPSDLEKGLYQFVGLEKADKLLEIFTLGELKGLIQSNRIENGFINNLFLLTQKVKGSKTEIMELIQKAGEGGKQDIEKLVRILEGRPSQFTYAEALEAIAKSKRFTADVAAAMADKEHGFEKMAKLVWGEDAKITNESIEVSAELRKGAADSGSAAIKRALKDDNKKKVLGAFVSSGGEVDYSKWKVLKKVIENSNIDRSIKNNIIGELWGSAHMEAYVQRGYHVIAEVKLTDGKTLIKADAVAMKGNEFIVLEFKSLEGELSEGQEIIYPMLSDTRIKSLNFPENSTVDAFFSANRDRTKFILLEEGVLVPTQ